MVHYIKGNIVSGKMIGRNVELVIAEHQGMFQSYGEMKLLLDESTARDFPPKMTGTIASGKMIGRNVELTISAHRGMFKSNIEMKMLLDEQAARDFTRCFPREVIGRELHRRAKGGVPLPETVLKYFITRKIMIEMGKSSSATPLTAVEKFVKRKIEIHIE